MLQSRAKKDGVKIFGKTNQVYFRSGRAVFAAKLSLERIAFNIAPRISPVVLVGRAERSRAGVLDSYPRKKGNGGLKWTSLPASLERDGIMTTSARICIRTIKTLVRHLRGGHSLIISIECANVWPLIYEPSNDDDSIKCVFIGFA